MTKDKLEAANALQKRIERLRWVLGAFIEQESKMDSEPGRMTGFKIEDSQATLLVINHQELSFLIDTFEKEIENLEREFMML